MQEVVARTPEFQSYGKAQFKRDTFFFKAIGLEHYERIEKVKKMILCLNHRQEWLDEALVSTKPITGEYD